MDHTTNQIHFNGVGQGLLRRQMVFTGKMVHSTHESPLVILENCSLGVDGNGRIKFMTKTEDLPKVLEKYGFTNYIERRLTNSQFLMPGLVDTHIHAPQYAYIGTALGLPLLDWLKNYTFPIESKFQDVEFAKRVYNKVVSRTLRNGTTTAQYFATNHYEASVELAQICKRKRQRAFVGKVNSDIESSAFGTDYFEETETSLEDTKRFIKAVNEMKCPLVQPVITPRFFLSCSRRLLEDLASLADKEKCRIQSHISENTDEIKLVLQKAKAEGLNVKTYTGAYEKVGLLTPKTTMAHGVYLSDEELDTFKRTGAGISHCPCSNIAIQSGIMDLRRTLSKGVKVGLGTDVSGGYKSSMFGAIQEAVTASNVITIQHYQQKGCTKAYQTVDYREAFRVATLKGSQVLGLEDTIGNFEVGKEFDALLIDPFVEGGPIDDIEIVDYKNKFEDIVERFIMLGDDRNIKEVYVQGHLVVPEFNVAQKGHDH